MRENRDVVLAWLADVKDQGEREKALPRALCRVCGGWARAGEGTRDDPASTAPRAHPTDPKLRIIPAKVTAPRNADDWRRECDVCAEASIADIVSTVMGEVVSQEVGSTVVRRMRTFDLFTGDVTVEFPTASAVGKATGRPWGHLTRDDRQQVRDVVAEVIRERIAGPCSDGACGVCGRREHLRWFEGPTFLRWPDGSRAPVCGTCQAVMDRRPDPLTIEALRVIGVEIATGHSAMFYTAPPQFRLYAETRGCDGNGYQHPWTYGEGVVAFIDDLWTHRPDLAPEERRDEYQAKFDAIAAARENEARELQEANRAEAW